MCIYIYIYILCLCAPQWLSTHCTFVLEVHELGTHYNIFTLRRSPEVDNELSRRQLFNYCIHVAGHLVALLVLTRHLFYNGSLWRCSLLWFH